MRTIKRLPLIVAILAVLACASSITAYAKSTAPADPLSAALHKAKAHALVSAQSWLTLFDSGKFGDTWSTSATEFQAAVSKDVWTLQATAAEDMTGPLISRKLKSEAYTEALPNAPPGRYIILEFNCEYQKRRTATETVAMTEESNGEWKVDGYYVAPPGH
jgi:hypothetical protein